ncbi:MAG: hypothetical protein F6J93_30740 [Oscillatoria sp. SIO1A7]|nr:hypothetical protein [Oscillatoria sp. SIO1A7]
MPDFPRVVAAPAGLKEAGVPALADRSGCSENYAIALDGLLQEESDNLQTVLPKYSAMQILK